MGSTVKRTLFVAVMVVLLVGIMAAVAPKDTGACSDGTVVPCTQSTSTGGK